MIPPAIDFDNITAIFRKAEGEDRDRLYEYEVYDLLNRSGAETPPAAIPLYRNARPSDEELAGIPGDRLVVKILSTTIVHKTEVGGVCIIDNHPDKIRSTRRRMMVETADSFHKQMTGRKINRPDHYEGLVGNDLLKAIQSDIAGVLLCRYMPPDSEAFGNELIVSLRRTREFGMVITAGLGGTDTELYANRFRKGQAVVSAATELTDDANFFRLFQKTIAYKKLAGLTRGQKRIVTDDQLIECFTSFIEMGNFYSAANPEAPYVIDELEVNPFAFTDYLMIPLDGMCRFSRPEPAAIPRPVAAIDKLLHPETIAIMGVSSRKMNFGRIILQNVLANGFDPSRVLVVNPGCNEIDGIHCIGNLNLLERRIDLLIVAIPADQVSSVIGQVIDLDIARSVMLIPGGMGEKSGSQQRAREIEKRINQAHLNPGGGPVFLGGNCLGVISHPGRYDTLFIPEEKLPKKRGDHHRNTAFISQSGAFMITRASKLTFIDPAYMISIGNQTDLTVGDLLTYMADQDDIDIIAVYMEGFNDLDGLRFCRAVRHAVDNGKEIVFYKAGRTPEGKNATAGHTASLAGDYMVCESCVHQAGAMVADTFTQFEDLFMLAARLHTKKINGNRLAAVSGAGFEAVGMADNIQGDDYSMEMAVFSRETEKKLKGIIRSKKLSDLVDVKNPMDINPAADDDTHAQVVEVMLSDDNVDGVVVGLDPLSPATRTLPGKPGVSEGVHSTAGMARLFSELAARAQKPLLGVVDSGRLYDPMVALLEENRVPVFRSSDRAVAALAKYIHGRRHAASIRRG